MPSGGNNRKPTVLKAIQGTLRNDRSNSNEPILPSSTPEMPKWINATAKKYFNQIVEHTVQMGVATKVDDIAFVLLANSIDLYVRANKEIKAHGLMVEAGSGGLKPNPAVGIRNQAEASIKSWLCEYGLTAASRAKVSADLKDNGKESDKPSFSDFIKK